MRNGLKQRQEIFVYRLLKMYVRDPLSNLGLNFKACLHLRVCDHAIIAGLMRSGLGTVFCMNTVLLSALSNAEWFMNIEYAVQSALGSTIYIID
jgi:hypothetical protein